MKKITNIPLKIIISIYMLAFAAILYGSNIGCIILKLTGTRCIGCGMTHALLRAVQLDFAGAFSYHWMFWSVPLLYLCFWLDGKLFPHKLANAVFYIVIAFGFLVNWIFRQFI